MMNFSSPPFGAILYWFVAWALILLVFRGAFLWYFKINQIVALLEEVRAQRSAPRDQP
jgi:hypothetical protein